jgi:hypothetical protein
MLTTECCSSAGSEEAVLNIVQNFPEIGSSALKSREYVLRNLWFMFLERLIKYEKKGWAPRFAYVFDYLAPYKGFLISYSSGMFAKLLGKLSWQPNQSVPELITILFQDWITYRNISYSIKKHWLHRNETMNKL